MSMEKLNCVLLVDDDMVINYLNEGLLKKYEITDNVKTALNGEEALLYLSKHSSPYDLNYPDLILLDYKMPMMEGDEFLEMFNQINSNQQHKSKIVVLTSFLTEDIKKQLLELGVDTYIEKPLSRSKLDRIFEHSDF